MPVRRTSTRPPVIEGRSTSYRLGPYRVLNAGDEADVRFPGRKNRKRAVFKFATRDTLVFMSPFTGGMVGVAPDAVGTIHEKRKLRGAS